MHKLLAALAVVSALGFASSAMAAPVQLSEVQLDQVTAGAPGATAIAGGLAFGNKSASSSSTTLTISADVHIGGSSGIGALGFATSSDSATGSGSGLVAAGSFAASSAHN